MALHREQPLPNVAALEPLTASANGAGRGRPAVRVERLAEARRRVQNETLGHRGRKADPLYSTRRLLVMADERLTHVGRERRRGLLAAGDPRSEVADAWQAGSCP